MSVVDAIIAKKLCGGGGGSVPKPLTYDYMPEGYPKKTVETVTVMAEQALTFTDAGGTYVANLQNGFKVTAGQTYVVNWDGTKYECVGSAIAETYSIGNVSIAGESSNTGEPFVYVIAAGEGAIGQFYTLEASASHTVSVTTTAETITPMAEEFLPNIPAEKLPAGGGGSSVPAAGAVTTLHINVTAVNPETMKATFTADKTPAEMEQAACDGPIWCVVSFAEGTMAAEAFSIGVPPAWVSGPVAFGLAIWTMHDSDGGNKFSYFVARETSDTWILDLNAFGS